MSEKIDLDTFDRTIAPKVISLGASCYPFMRMKNLFSTERYLFDSCRCSHQVLLTMLKSKFRNILNPIPAIPNQNAVRIGFYDEYSDFWVGHRKREQMPDIDATIRRRAKRFLDLVSSNEHIVFIRLRNYYFDPSTFLEPCSSDEIVSMFETEYDQIVLTLKELGFKNFEVFYIISSPILTLDGFITIPEGPISESMYCLEDPESFSNKNWKGCFDFLNSIYSFPTKG